MHPLDFDTGRVIGRSKRVQRVSTVVTHTTVERSHREHERGDEHDHGAARDDQPVCGAQGSDMILDMFEDIEGDKARVVSFGRIEDVEILYLDPRLIREPTGESR